MAVATATTTTTFLLLLFILTATTTNSAPTFTNSIPANFTASHFQFIDQAGDFLRSTNRTYTAAIANPQPTSPSFYLLIYHTQSHTVIWSANRNNPISNSAQIRLTTTGLAIYKDSGEPVWSTPPVDSAVDALQMLDSGNLILVDRFNRTLWQSFDFPTDTIVPEQRLPVGGSLISSKSPADFSTGDYEFELTAGDGILRWEGLTYYRLLMDSKSVRNSNDPFSYLTVNGSGFYLFGDSGSGLAARVLIPAPPAVEDSDYRILKISDDGYLVVTRFTNNVWVTDFTTPADDTCRNPSRCGKLGLCSGGGCSCPPGFRSDRSSNGCSPADTSLSLPESCAGDGSQRRSNSSESYMYIQLGNGVDYFSIGFIDPVKKGVNLSNCEDLCSRNCSCLGFFHGSPSNLCYLLENHLGSITSSSNDGGNNPLGFIKAISSSSLSRDVDDGSKSDFPVAGLVLLPASGVLLISIFSVWIAKRRRSKKSASKSKKSMRDSFSGDLEVFSIAGLPVRYDYDDLVEATGDFGTPIGSGGFGTVYKGVLRDKTAVAVKKITALGAQGKKEFGTEIAIIGNIHHVNLVKLKGFCAHGTERFLVYEYMSRGSLDRTLFGSGPPLEWQERFEIALGTARGLAYLHHGCEHKIIHCDVKPENILLNDNMQVKISDFGLSKLLSPEQSGLFTTMRGTRGYLAPEWLTNAAISDKTDVYSYGMVLLELIQGRKNCVQVANNRSSGNPASSTDGRSRSSGSSGSRNHPRPRSFYFPLHALEMHEECRYLELVEPRLAGRVAKEDAEKLVKVALCCLHEDPSLRPTMANVVGMLEGVLAVGEPRLECLNFLRFYGRRFTEASVAGSGAEVEIPNRFMVVSNEDNSSSATVSLNSFSYMSSQQVSGPR